MKNLGLASVERIGELDKAGLVKVGHTERKLKLIDNKETKGNDALREAQKALLGNENLYNKFFKGLTNKLDRQGADASSLAGVENIFITYCQNLSDVEIESLVRQFNKGFKDYIRVKKGDINLSEQRLEEINKKEITARGIISVVQFIRARKKLLDLKPSQEYAFYFEDVLDARYQIDLIECIYNRNGQEVSIDSMNLIQVKSSEPSEEEQERITRAHKEWLTSSVMDLDSFEHEYSDGIPENLTIESLLKNADEVENILLDICTDPNRAEIGAAEEFISKLDLGELSNKHKAWLLLQYGKRLKDLILGARKKRILTNLQARDILTAIERLGSSVMTKAKMPKNFSTVQEINSAISVGARIIKKENLFGRGEDSRHKKIMNVA